ncbi:NAD(P)-binding oxidoreductase [Lentilactobacillus sp. SPB1-3]|uniref:NAD(P)-binding oxidoreductase n=1 Tax=Lentilactobacillus terminaliae TaxID=3003483 RepID=A0ACD5DDK4_9LACO|nr:NAD(P)-binding oxidoreductase [Lentilactobacillus sp. SPB1-3]MCZ0977705.1 SDR family oxidoreductase [Lentilactobacillus sp. SPB1-3]
MLLSQQNIDRYVMESATGAESRSTWDVYDTPSYYVTKYYAEEILKKSGLKYTVIRPAILSDGDETNTISIDGNGHNDVVFRADVAAVVVKCLHDTRAFNQGFNLYGGTTSIDESFDELNAN